jgi:uncharacterized protein (TIGR02217 family)
MSLTILTDVRLDNCSIAYNVRGKVKRSNTRAVDGGGYPKVNINWSRSTREYEFGIVPMSIQAWREIESLFEATDGGAYGFLLQDPKDSIVSDTDGLLMPWSGSAAITGSTIGLGYGVPTYRMFRRYVNASRTTDRLITRPMTGLVLRRAASVVTQGASPGNASVNLDTGTVTFVADTFQALTSTTAGASTVLTFANNTGMLAATAINDRVYITGVSGARGALLNDRSHLVTARDMVAFTLTISTTTTGTTGGVGGTALRYPQPSQSLTWTGGFWTPVHFANDELDWEIMRSGSADSRIVAGPLVVLNEVRER